MRALAAHLRYRILAGVVLATVGNSGAAASKTDQDVLKFKATSPVMRPQTLPKSPRIRVDSTGGVTLVSPVVFTQNPAPTAPAVPIATVPPPVVAPVKPVQTTLPTLATPAPAPITPVASPIPVTNAPVSTAVPIEPPPATASPAQRFRQPLLTSGPLSVTPQGSSPISNAPIARPIPPPPIAEPPNKTQAGLALPGCPDGTCAGGPRRSPNAPISSKVAGLDDSGKYHSAQEKCYSQALLQAAKSNVARNFRNRPKSKGFCAYGVRTSINAAGIFGGSLGNAIDYSARGKLGVLGFKNYISEYGNDMSKIPAGAVLVFAGPKTSEYLRSGYTGPTGHKGTYVGHVTIKGDDGRYYTDGRTSQPAIGWPGDKSSRRLVGVYLMQSCTASCSQKLRDRCG